MTKFGYGNFRGEITDTEISEFMEANGLGVTIYPDKALFINPDGDLINSKEDERQADGRTEDHRIVSDIIAEGEYMDTNPGLFWGAFHDKTRMIRYVPESNEALIEENQVPTTFQRDTLEKLGATVEKYVDYNKELNIFLRNHKSSHEITKEDLDRFVFEKKPSGNIEIISWKPQGVGNILVIPNQADLRNAGILKSGRNAYISKHTLHNIALEFNDLPGNGLPKILVANSHSFSKLPIIDEDLSALFSEPKGFVGLDKIVKMDLKELDVRNATNMKRMFNGVESLRELDISSWNTGNVEDMTQMFAGADALHKLDLSNWNTHKVQNMKGMFSMTAHLEQVKGIENWDTGNVQTMRNMFAGTGELTKHREKPTDLSNWDTSRVEDMSYMFGGCSNLQEIVGIEDLDTSHVKDMCGMFDGFFDKGLEKLDLSQWNVSNVRNMANMFCSNYMLKELNVSGWDVSNVKNMSEMFDGAKTLGRIIGHEDWDVSNVRNMSRMFLDTKNLQKLDMSKWKIAPACDLEGIILRSGVRKIKTPETRKKRRQILQRLVAKKKRSR